MDSSLPNVYELAQRRLKFLFEAFDNIYVSFSGGKDSSVLLNLCIDYIRRHGLDRKIGVFHMDYEIQYRDTVAHVDQVLASNADILEVYRVCVPFKVPTCTSMFQPYWRPWEECGKCPPDLIRAKIFRFFRRRCGITNSKAVLPCGCIAASGPGGLVA
jgi:predicted phosphoadenosine phosphosulfate sulfurtransferase